MKIRTVGRTTTRDYGEVMNPAKKCRALGCNRKTRTPFCWQHADMDTASHFPGEHPGRKIGRTCKKNAMDEFCAKLKRK